MTSYLEFEKPLAALDAQIRELQTTATDGGLDLSSEIARLEENLAAARVALTPAQTARIEAVFAPGAAQGGRYPDAGWAGVETRR